jgi:Flp pilus assembly pilin Flp
MLEYALIRLKTLIGDRKGISSLEYAVMAVGIVGAVAAAAVTLGTDIADALNNIGSYISGKTIT